MRIIALVLGLILLTPAVTRACECCPSTPQDGKLVIQKAPCHGCCPEFKAPQETQSALDEKSVFLVSPSRGLVSALHIFQAGAVIKNAEKKDPLFFVSALPPPLSFGVLPLVLRI